MLSLIIFYHIMFKRSYCDNDLRDCNMQFFFYLRNKIYSFLPSVVNTDQTFIGRSVLQYTLFKIS